MSGALQPPFYDPPITDYPSGQQHSQAWTEYHQSVADQLTALTAMSANTGVTNGSDAATGKIGEYFGSAINGPGVGVANGGTSNVTTLALTAGDWSVSGEVWMHVGAGGATQIHGGVSMVSATLPGTPGFGLRESRVMALPANSDQILSLGSARFNLAAAATVYLVAGASFPSGAVTAYGMINARRMR